MERTEGEAARQVTVITEPGVTLLSHPVFSPHPRYAVPLHKYQSESLIAHAGKGCYDSYGLDGRSVGEHIESLMVSRHGSVLEHANVSVFIEGISRGLSHELVRHRAGFAYSQRSTRYTKEDDAACVLEPYYAMIYLAMQAGFEQVEGARYLVESQLDLFRLSLDHYKSHVSTLISLNKDEMDPKDLRKWARGKARQLLPHSLETRLTVTANLRAWRFFFEQRGSKYAEPEIRRLACAIFLVIQPLAPNVFSDFRMAPEVYGVGELSNTLTKV